MKIEADWLHDAGPKAVISMLAAGGFQGYFVGGCVRNALLGTAVSDLDLASSATPEQVIACAQVAGMKAIPTGIDHGTITVVFEKTPFEITTFRKDVTTDGRHAEVAFTTDIHADAARRDFTMNALYCDGQGNVIDPLGGIDDLRARHVRFIRDPHERIREDYLRILRFFRFHAWYGDDGIDADGLAACAELSDGLQQIARERITSELLKLLAAPNPAPSVAAMGMSYVLSRCVPGADAAMLAPLVHLEEQLLPDLAPCSLRRLAVLGGEDVPEALRLSKSHVRHLAALREHMSSTMPAGELGYRLGIGMARDVLLLRAASLSMPFDMKQLAEAESAARQKFPISAKDLNHMHQGPALGQALRAAEADWIASGFALGCEALIGRYG